MDLPDYLFLVAYALVVAGAVLTIGVGPALIVAGALLAAGVVAYASATNRNGQS